MVCQHLAGHAVYEWEQYGFRLDAPAGPPPDPPSAYHINQFGGIHPVAKVDNRHYQLSGDHITVLVDLSHY